MTEPNRQSGEKEERIIEIEIERLRPFKEHPFQVKDDKEMFLLQESIEKYGILNPLIVRPVPDGYYEIISGHRRKHAAEKLGYRKVPVIIRVLSEDDSILSMVDSNLHRERISYSEKAFAYKLKNDVLKRKSGRKKSQVDHKTPRKRSIDIISEDCGDSPKQVQPDVKKVMNNSKVTDHHAIIPTMELASSHLDELKSWEEKILFLIAVHTVMAMSKDHIYRETEIEVECQGEIFKAKGKIVLQDGWKLFENCFKNKDRMAIVDPDQEMKERMPKVTQGQTFYAVAAEKTEHFTSPPKPYSEDTLLAAMETAGNKEFDEDTEKKGLGTPATRAGIIEKLIYSQYATRKGKQILPTDDGKVLVEILPDFLKSASMTAEWENQLLLMEHGEIAPEQFMTGIKNMLTMMLNGCDAISEEETRRFQTRESIGTCPVCGSLVYESKTNFYCSNHDCHFALWKDNRYLQSMEKNMDKKMAAELLKSGCVHVKDLYSRKKNMYFEADLHMDADETGKVNFSLSFPKKKPKNKSKKK